MSYILMSLRSYNGKTGPPPPAARGYLPGFDLPAGGQLSNLLLVLVAISLLTGCAGHVNPKPVAQTGYVDFYCETAGDLSWDVLRFDLNSGKMKPAFSRYKPLPGNVLRVTSPVGTQRFQVGIFNKANRGPVQVVVDVEAGKVTPVKITLEHLGEVWVNREVYAFRGSSKGYAGGTKIVSEKNDAVRIHVEGRSPQLFQPKENVAYFNSGVNENKLMPTGR
jgi:hypothetical protein